MAAAQLRDVRFGSKADMCSAKWHFRFVPIADIGWKFAMLRERTAHCCHGYQCDRSLCT